MEIEDHYPEEDFEMLYEQEMEMRKDLEIKEQEEAAAYLASQEIVSQTQNIPIPVVHSDPTKQQDPAFAKRNLFSDSPSSISEKSLNENQDRNKRTLAEDGSLNTDLGSNSLISCFDSRSPLKKKIKLGAPAVEVITEEKMKLKKKMEDEEDKLILLKVKMYRKEVEQSFLNETESRLMGSRRQKKKVVYHQHIPDGDFQSITTVNGARFYLDMLDDDHFNQQIKAVSEKPDSFQLLPQPIAKLMVEARDQIANLNGETSTGTALLPIPNSTNADISESDSGVEEDMEGTADLWVSKYRPQSYFDLLSDESTNRCVLRWIKLWDKLVFHRERKAKNKENIPKEVKNNKFNKFQFKKKGPEVIEEFDEQGRPQQKVILLCGPPGLGKTTLAHIIAEHAGYNVVEMNASDDRSVDVFKKNLENATSMKAVFGNDRRPNCLIIDEIDGAPAASVNFLANTLQGKKETKGMKGKKENLVMRRPVICICNDLYALSLRPLRQMALIIPFPPTQQARLAERLLSISVKQNLRADLSSLMALCDKTENDIRSCLSVMQFIRSTTGELRLSDLDGVTVGQKDYQKSLFSVWHDIFTVPRFKQKRRGNPHKLPAPTTKGKAVVLEKTDVASFDNTSPAARFQHIQRTAQSCGEFDKLTLGWFENYLNIKFKHTNLDSVVKGLEWTGMSDILQREIGTNQNWILNPYISYSFVAYHFLFAAHSWPKLKFPIQHSESTTKLLKSQNLLSVMSSGMSVDTLLFTPSQMLVRDVLPYLMTIMQLPLRPVNVQLFSKHEKQDLHRLVNTMISYNLTYQQERTIEGHYSFNLDPNIEEVVHFKDVPLNRTLTYGSKQVVAREVELERVRRSEKYFESCAAKPSTRPQVPFEKAKTASTQMKSATKETPSVSKPAVVPNHLKKLEAIKPVSVLKKDTVVRDFFGKIIEGTDINKKKGIKNEVNPNAVWYRYKEGYTNAFRKPVKNRFFI